MAIAAIAAAPTATGATVRIAATATVTVRATAATAVQCSAAHWRSAADNISKNQIVRLVQGIVVDRPTVGLL